MRVTNVVVAEVGPVVTNKFKRSKYRIIKFTDLYDDQIAYTLCVMNGHKGASRFEKYGKGTKLAGVVVYSEEGKNLVDGNSNFHVMRSNPLF